MNSPGPAALARAHPTSALSVLVEDAAAALELPDSLTALCDLNPGMDRTGADPADSEWFRAAGALGSAFRGLHYYDGHHVGPEPERARECRAGYETVLDCVALLADGGRGQFEVVTSGTPAFRHALQFFGERPRPGMTVRVSPGTVLFHDARSEQQLPGLGFQPAACVLSRVVSRPGPGRVTCDAGSKSIAAEAGDPCAVVLGRPELTPARPSEEHLPLELRAGPDPRPARGEVLWLWPRHVCPTVNLAEQAWWIDPPAAPRLVELSARAHDADIVRA